MTSMICKWKSIHDCQSFSALQRLAKAPFDLTGHDALTPDRLQEYVCEGVEFDLLYSCQRITPEVLDCLQSLADECALVEQYRQMRGGAVMNKIDNYPSDERQVLHTSCRDIFSNNPACEAASQQAKAELEKLNQFLHELDTGSVCNAKGEQFDTFIHIGIGGSDLGPRSVYEALLPYRIKGRKVYFVSNVDPDDAAAVLGRVDLSKTLVLVVSKSGTTLETLSNESLLRAALMDQGLDPDRQCIAVTGESSPMDNPDRYLRSFFMFDYIGGRFSATSMVGVVMLGFALGYEQVLQFLEGAALMDTAADEKDVRRNLPLLLAMLGVWNRNFLGMNTVAILPYSQGLHRFPAHLQQCDMESNGKSVQRSSLEVQLKSGPIVWGEPGTNGQHAFYQLLHQGTEDVAVEFIGFRQSRCGMDMDNYGSSSQQKLVANLLAQSMALAVGKNDENPNKRFAGNRVNVVLMGEKLAPKSMGALLALYEAKIVFQGFCWNVNSFDQEGVQFGKVLAGQVLSHMLEKKSGESLAAAFLKAAGIV